MAYLIGKLNSPIGKKVHLGPVGVSLEKALLWISEKYFEFNGKEISADELNKIQSRGKLNVRQFYLCFDKDIDAKS